MVARRVVEALFAEEAIELDGALREKLAAIGLKTEVLEPEYPLALLRQTVDVVRRHVWPALPPADGFREVGRRWVRGFKHTPIGWLFRTMAPIFGPDRTLQTLPRYLTTVRKDMPLRVYPEAANRYRLVCADLDANPHFLAGCIEVLLETAGAGSSTVEVKAGADGFELEVTFS